MGKITGILQFMYPLFGLFFIVEAVSTWGEDSRRSIMLLVFAGVAIFMFFFRRKYGKRFEAHYKNKEDQKKNKK